MQAHNITSRFEKVWEGVQPGACNANDAQARLRGRKCAHVSVQ
jgi:hypothetical protein